VKIILSFNEFKLAVLEPESNTQLCIGLAGKTLFVDPHIILNYQLIWPWSFFVFRIFQTLWFQLLLR
jgi:hypothetical protein